VRYRLCHISIAPKWSKYSVVILLKIADFLSYQGGALIIEGQVSILFFIFTILFYIIILLKSRGYVGFLKKVLKLNFDYDKITMLII